MSEALGVSRAQLSLYRYRQTDWQDGRMQRHRDDAKHAVRHDLAVLEWQTTCRLATADDDGDTGEQLERTERHEDRGNLHLGDQPAVEGTRKGTDDERAHDGGDDGEVALVRV